MTLVRWTPRARQLTRAHDTFDDFVREFFGDSAAPWRGGSALTGDWMPATDVVEEEGRFVAHLDLPGLRREDIKISMENGTLTVSGERQNEVESKKDGFRRFERSYGAFSRSFGL